MTRPTLEQRLEGKAAQPWIPDPAKLEKYDRDACGLNPLIGTAVDHFRRRNFMDDGEYDVVVLLVPGVGEVAVHCQPTVLSNEMRQARPKPGEKVGVKWLGVKEGARNTYSAFKVVVERTEGGTFDWGDGTTTAQPEGREGSWRRQDDRPPEQDQDYIPSYTDDDVPF